MGITHSGVGMEVATFPSQVALQVIFTSTLCRYLHLSVASEGDEAGGTEIFVQVTQRGGYRAKSGTHRSLSHRPSHHRQVIRTMDSHGSRTTENRPQWHPKEKSDCPRAEVPTRERQTSELRR